MEGELLDLELAKSEVEWFTEFYPSYLLSMLAILIYCDNQATLAKVKSKNYNSKSSRYIELIYKILKKLNTIRIIILSYVKSKKKLIDHLTKGLSREQVLKSSIRIGLKHIS